MLATKFLGKQILRHKINSYSVSVSSIRATGVYKCSTNQNTLDEATVARNIPSNHILLYSIPHRIIVLMLEFVLMTLVKQVPAQARLPMIIATK